MRLWDVQPLVGEHGARGPIGEIIIAKQRNGPIGDFKLVFRNDITKFLGNPNR